MKFTIDISLWRRGGDLIDDEGNALHGGEGDTMLLNPQGYMCCLGFCARQIDPNANILEMPTPSSLQSSLEGLNFFEISKYNGKVWENTKFADEAIDINDDESIDDDERMRKLTALFSKHGHEIEFI